MAAEDTTPLAPPQGVAANGAEGAPSESLAAPQGLIPRREVTFTLRRPSGTVVGEFTRTGVERFAQELDYSIRVLVFVV